MRKGKSEERKGKNEGRNDIGVIGIKVKEIIQDNVFDLFLVFFL